MLSSPCPPPESNPRDPALALLAACSAPTALLDAQGRLVEANTAFAQRLPLAPGALLATALDTTADTSAAALAAAGELQPRASGVGYLQVRAIDGTGFWLVQWIERAADVSAEQRQLQMFADTVAHDLRAPLRSIDSFAKLLEDRAAAKLDATERMHLSRIRTAAGRMGSLLTALGELSRAASASMQQADVDMSLLAEWVLAELHDAEQTRNVAVEVQPGLHALGDERLLKQLLHMLLDNAWRFTRGREPARIEVTGQVTGSRLRLQIRDSGAGFDMTYAHKLFQPFQRLHGVEQGAGHGLGLAIAQRIAQRHGGAVMAVSSVDEGSTFTVDLPAAPGAEGGAHA